MKANEFVKKFGWDKTKEVITKFHNNELQSCCFDSGLINGEDKSWWDICVYDLKRLVESHNLVGRFGGLHMAKADVMDLDGWEKTSPYWMKIQQAIADVESCQ